MVYHHINRPQRDPCDPAGQSLRPTPGIPQATTSLVGTRARSKRLRSREPGRKEQGERGEGRFSAAGLRVSRGGPPMGRLRGAATRSARPARAHLAGLGRPGGRVSQPLLGGRPPSRARRVPAQSPGQFPACSRPAWSTPERDGSRPCPTILCDPPRRDAYVHDGYGPRCGSPRSSRRTRSATEGFGFRSRWLRQRGPEAQRFDGPPNPATSKYKIYYYAYALGLSTKYGPPMPWVMTACPV